MKSNHRHIFFNVVLIIFAQIISIILFNRLTKESISNSASFITAVIGVLAIWYQMKKDADISKAEFILTLNSNFQSNENINYIYSKLKENRDGKEVTFTPEDGRKMGEYVMFFQTMYFLISEGVISMSMIDRLFANKFFIFMNNHDVQEYQLKYTSINKPILELYCVWTNYRTKNHLPLLYPEHMPQKMMKDYFVTKHNKLVLNESIVIGY